MSEIAVESSGDHGFLVTVTDDQSTTTHQVTVDPAAADRLGGGVDEAELVAASFRFLLAREPKESIMRRFDLSVISRFFPEYESRIAEYLTGCRW